MENRLTEVALRNLPRWGQFIRFGEDRSQDGEMHKTVHWAWDPGKGQPVRKAAFDITTGEYITDLFGNWSG